MSKIKVVLVEGKLEEVYNKDIQKPLHTKLKKNMSNEPEQKYECIRYIAEKLKIFFIFYVHIRVTLKVDT